MTEAIFGLLGVLLGALVSGVIMWTVARRDRLHSEERETTRSLGIQVLDVLISDEWADAREVRLIAAAVRGGVAVDFRDDSVETETSGGVS